MAGEQTLPETVPLECGDGEHACLRCSQACSVAGGAVPRALGLVCRLCNNVYQVLYRHLGGVPPGVQQLSGDEQKKFFARAGSIVRVQPKGAIWKLVRQELKSTLVHFRTQQTRKRVNHEHLPLGVWKTRGFDIDVIQQKGEKVMDPVLWLH